MTLYSIHARSEPLSEPAVIADRFSWTAALLAPIYALAHGLWLAAVALVVAIVALGFAAMVLGAAAFWLYVLVAVFFGFEVNALRRRKAERRGLLYRGELVAFSPEEAMRDWLKGQATGQP
ncbi:MAG: hypothetical protein JWR75_663 [Devosia sp.]|nr:hypothetical protein [Devosia sp.]